ncbi:MAG: very short patch repair endonuclease [Microbacteriaceae bacterium]|nr:very short patch repair endonuclease [Microbacteriaceae bacterium]MCL2796116.1 very short patch repair endonuclease [Microbacteriaceae bacterium]
MSQPPSLPDSLGTTFSTATALAAGVTPSRLRNAAISQPFRGANVVGIATALTDRAAACAVRTRGTFAFCGVTAAALHGVPLPPGIDMPHRPLDVAVVAPRTPPRAEGITGHSFAAHSFRVVMLAGLPVVEATAAWCQLAEALSREDLVAAGDFLLSGDPWESHRRQPRCTLEQLTEAVRRHAGKRGAKKLRWALARVRHGVDSRPETLLRLLLVAAGVPEPVIRHAIPVADGRLVLHPDLALPQFGVVFEYQGDGHRERDRFLSDIERDELIRAEGWEVVQVTSKDLFGNRRIFIERVFAVLRRRGLRLK